MQFDADLMQGNLEVLARRWPRLLEQLPEPDAIQDLDFELVADTPRPALRVNGIQLVSAYDPEAEAELQAEMIDNTASKVWLYGCSVGFLPRCLLQRQALKQLNFVIMHRGLFVMLMAAYDLRDVLNDRKMELVLPEAGDGAHEPAAVEPACLALADDYAARIRDQLETNFTAAKINQQFAAMQADIDARIAEIESYIASDGDVASVFGAFKGKCGLVVAPGPTLSDNLEDLRQWHRQGHPLIAVDAAVKPLLKAGLTPDYVLAIDRKPAIFSMLDGAFEPLKDSTLIYHPVVEPRVLAHWQGPRLVAYSPSPQYDAIRKRHPRGNLWAAGTVMHAAVDFAVQTGCRQVRLYGVDLAFPGDRYYAGDVDHDRKFMDKATAGGRASGERWVVNGHGEKIRSIANFVLYLRQLEQFIAARPQARFINMSRQGAQIHGTCYPDELS